MKSKNRGMGLAWVSAGLMIGGAAEASQASRGPRAPAGASYAQPGQAELPPANPQQDGAPPPSDGPQGSSQLRAGEERFDRVGYAGYAGPGAGIFANSADLPVGTHAEVTSLDSGRTIVVPIKGVGPGLIDLSGAAAKQLGVTGNPPVRVRRITPSPSDTALLAAGETAPTRADAPPALLTGLRKQLGARPVESRGSAKPATPRRADAPAKPPRTAPPPRTAQPARAMAKAASPPQRPASRGLFVQVAALSNAQRAQALASQLGGIVRTGGSVYRVQIGPYPNAAAAQRARADVARRGYGDARIVQVP